MEDDFSFREILRYLFYIAGAMAYMTATRKNRIEEKIKRIELEVLERKTNKKRR